MPAAPHHPLKQQQVPSQPPLECHAAQGALDAACTDPSQDPQRLAARVRCIHASLRPSGGVLILLTHAPPVMREKLLRTCVWEYIHVRRAQRCMLARFLHSCWVTADCMAAAGWLLTGP
jgi:hypothetical protein